MKSSVFLHVFNNISTYAYVFTEYFLHSFSNLSIEFHLVLLRMQYFSYGSDEIKMCDLEPFSKIQSHSYIIIWLYIAITICLVTVNVKLYIMLYIYIVGY